MKCPYCAHPESKVIDSRPAEEGSSIRRRRECEACGKRFTTYEKVERTPIMVVKKDKNRELFNREKLTGGILKSCEKRPVTALQIEEMVDDIEAAIYNSLEKEVTSEQLGAMVMERLKNIDQVSYVRFASVYREFKDIDTFLAELNKLLKDKD